MKRQIIKIDQDKCNGCGQCLPGCPEGALQLIDGKARLISDLFCDGLGACLGTCPLGAIEVEEREAEPYDERRVMENIIEQGPNVVRAHLLHLKEHNEMELFSTAREVLKEKGLDIELESDLVESPCHSGSCPGAAMRALRHRQPKASQASDSSVAGPAASASAAGQSQLRQWPVQLQLLNPHAPYFRDADLLVSADCVPYAYANFHQRFLKNKIMITFCPKLDQTIDQYVEKLTVIFSDNHIKSVSVLHMEVPCCSGTLYIVQQALEKAKKIIPINDYTISISGELI